MPRSSTLPLCVLAILTLASGCFGDSSAGDLAITAILAPAQVDAVPCSAPPSRSPCPYPGT